MQLKSNRDVVDRFISNLENDFRKLIPFRPGFIVYPLSEGRYSANYYNRNLTFNIDIMFNTGYNLPYIYIVKFEVFPTGKERGTLLIKRFLQRLEEEKRFSRVYLKSINEESTKFWQKTGFQHISNGEEKLDLGEDVSTIHHMYKINLARPNMMYIIS